MLGLALAGCGNSSRKAFQEGQKAEALLQAGDLLGARAAIARALSYRDDQVDLLLLDGQIKLAQKDTAAAFDSYNTALALDPSNATALAAVSQLGMATGHQAEATTATDQILASDPRQPDALLLSGVLAINKKDLGKAMAQGDKLLSILPSDPRGIVL